MSDISPLPTLDRRRNDRISLSMYLTEYIDERPHRALASNLSPTGLYLHRVWKQRERAVYGREQRLVQLEFKLPRTKDTIWALGEVCYDELSLDGESGATGMCHAAGVTFKRMAGKHASLISEYVEDFAREKRRQKLAEMHALFRLSRFH